MHGDKTLDVIVMKTVGTQDWTRYRGKGYMGLANLGNTCFMNTCLQVLNHVYELNQLFLEQQLHRKKATKGNGQAEIEMVKEWVELQELMWGEKSVDALETGGNMMTVSPNKFVQYIHHLAKVKNKDIFTGWAQNDLPEFLLFFMEGMHHSICRGVKLNIRGKKETPTDATAVLCYNMLQTVYEKEYSEVMDLFYGIYVSEIMSKEGALLSQKAEQFFIVDLPLPMQGPIIHLYDCWDLFTEGEALEGDNAWYNETTHTKQSVTKRIRFWNFPPILVISLKRFSSMGHLKRQDLVTFPLEGLNLSKYVCGYHPQRYVYDLMGVCNHMGGVMGGHYTAFVKNAEGKWLHFNDTMVEKVANPQDMVRPMAYCLFYRIRSS